MKKKVLLGLTAILLIYILYVFIQFNNSKNIEKNCLVSDFETVFGKEDSIKLGKIYNFSKILNCKNWDEIIIVGGEKANRTIIFLKEGIALPKIDYINRIKGVLLFYLVKDGKLISPPLSLWQPSFLYFKDFNGFDYISLDRKDALFKSVKLETIGSKDEILTFELIDN
jgi:hypothetical protein